MTKMENMKGMRMSGDSRSGKGKMDQRSRTVLIFAVLIFAALVAAALNLLLGNLKIPLGKLIEILFFGKGSSEELQIIWTIRFPRMIAAGILGGALALSGFLLQTFFHNPIAGPFILGISSGAKFAVSLILIVLIGRIGYASNSLLVLAAFAGSLLATGWIILISRYIRHMASLLAAGIMIGYILNAATDFLITFADDSDLANLHGWSQGSFSGMDASAATFSAVIVLAASILIFLLSKPIGAFRLGESYAADMGVNVRRFRLILILLSSTLSACVTAFAGPVSFVGIAVPYLCRLILKSSKPILLIPASFLGGAAFCLISDLIARLAFAPTELNISTVTSLIGAPIVIFMIIRMRRGDS
jgi:iron complex transport system permease protein